MPDEQSDHGLGQIVQDEIDNSQPEPPAPEGESKSDKFKRLAIYRVNKAIERITQIGHLSNRSQYEFTADQVEKMRGRIQLALDSTFDRFAEKKSSDGFSFDD